MRTIENESDGSFCIHRESVAIKKILSVCNIDCKREYAEKMEKTI